MSEKHLHIITHEVPWPADFGGVVDLFYKLKALHSEGIKIHLHCFTKGRKPQSELNKYCETVNYYRRNNSVFNLSFTRPFIVQSRNNKKLLEALLKDDFPILFEGIHCTYYLQNIDLQNRKLFLRLHNVEFQYYGRLAKHEHNIFKKIYFVVESFLLKKYERSIANAAPIMTVSEDDVTTYKKSFRAEDIAFLPVFLPFENVTSKIGLGTYCLYQGNLSVNENEAAAIWLLTEVFNEINIDFIIAGKSPSAKLAAMIAKNKNAKLITDPSEDEMQELIANAQVNVLPSFNKTGVKLKLLNALYTGRHCLVNDAGVSGSGLESVCFTANDAVSFQQKITELSTLQFTEEHKNSRKVLLQSLYNNQANAKKLIDKIWS